MQPRYHPLALNPVLDTFEIQLTRVCRIAIGLSFAVLIIAVLTQVIGRTLGSSPVWTEELTRFALLYIAAIGAGLSLQSGDLVNVDIFCDAFGMRASRAFKLVSSLLTIAMSALLVIPAWQFVSIGALQTSPALGLRMTWIHLSVFVLLVLLGLFASLRVIKLFTSPADKPKDT